MVGCVPVEDLSCVYQPIVDLQTGRAFAFEVLARCRVPGLTNPEILFKRAAAERFCGLLGRTLRAVGSAGCRGIPLFLNVHPREFADGLLVRANDPIFSHGHDVFLEITESMPIDAFTFSGSVLREVRSKGVRLVVDDLGAGFSNLRYIADLEPEMVKVDRALIEPLPTQERVRRLFGWLVRMCEDMGAAVVAEGIETDAEFEILRQFGCRYGQGYLLGRPSPPSDVSQSTAELADSWGQGR